MKKIAFIGSEFGHGAQITATSRSPRYLKEQYELVNKLNEHEIKSYWYDIVSPANLDENTLPNKGRHFNSVLEHNQNLSSSLRRFIKEKTADIPCVIGGDHSCAIGTWSGIIDSLNANRQFGLIWIDAHMDAHVYETSPPKAYHGMPLSVLLGCGDNDLCSIGNSSTKIDPKHLVLIGVRSFEPGEAELLQSLGVKIYSNEETIKMGYETVFQEALAIVTTAACGFGISFDLDAIDPLEAPGVGSPEPNGLDWKIMNKHLPILFQDPKLVALEITEFNPERDSKDKTADIVFEATCQLGKIACL